MKVSDSMAYAARTVLLGTCGSIGVVLFVLILWEILR